MAELVDARDSKSRDCEVMGVRFPLPAPSKYFNELYYAAIFLWRILKVPLVRQAEKSRSQVCPFYFLDCVPARIFHVRVQEKR